MWLGRNALFELWAPAVSPWSAWTKPLLFAHLPTFELPPAAPLPLKPPIWAPPADGTTSVVADLPGVRSLRVAQRLVSAGFRPVPLFNSIPGPIQPPDELRGPRSSIDVYPILRALEAATKRSASALLALPPEAPPAFLLDSARRHGLIPRPGDFDNRSISLPTDFPSASFLKAHGVVRVVLLVAEYPHSPATDLSHTLLRWQEAGIQISTTLIEPKLRGLPPQPIRVHEPPWFRAIWHNALITLGLRRSPLGGFGGTLPNPSAG
jgi:hypothetical protein